MKTVRVRIAVAVGEHGEWSVGGNAWLKDGALTALSDEEARGNALDCLDDEGAWYAIHWVEADVPMPESKTVEGSVSADSADDDVHS